MSTPDRPAVGVVQDRDTGEWLVVTPDANDPSQNIEHYRVIGHRLAMYRANSLYKRLLATKKVEDEKKAKLAGVKPYNYHMDESGRVTAVNPQKPFVVGPNGTLIQGGGLHTEWDKPGKGGSGINIGIEPQGGARGRGGSQKAMAEKPKLPSLRPKLIALGIDALMLALEYTKRSQREVE